MVSNGCVSIAERFCLFIHRRMGVQAHFLGAEEIASLRRIFEAVDANNNGQISGAELSVIIKSFGKELSDFEIHDLIAQVDVGESAGDGLLDFEVNTHTHMSTIIHTQTHTHEHIHTPTNAHTHEHT